MMFSHKKKLLALFALLGLCSIVGAENAIFIPRALAQATVATPPLISGTISDLLQKLSYINGFMNTLLFIVLWMLQYLMSSGWFTDPAMTDFLRGIWIFSRDVMNVLFALMLIGVAFYTIIMADPEYVKRNIARFVLAVILVNFSWFFPRVILDVSAILTATIYNLPNAMTGGPSCQVWEYNEATRRDEVQECRVITNVNVLPTEAEINACNALGDPKKCSCNAIVCTYRQGYREALTNGYPQSHVILNGLALSFAKIQTITRVPGNLLGAGATAADRSAALTKGVITILMVFFIQVLVLLPLIALCAAMFLRTLVLWVTIAFMPFAFLGFVVSGKMGTGGIVDGLEDYIWSKFISAAFLPAKVALPFAIGFIMLTAASNIPVPDLGITLGAPIIYGVGSVWGMMWMIIAGIIIWKGAFDAMSKSDFSKGITDKIRGVGETIGGAAARLPLLTPLPLPGIGGKNMNIGDIVNAPNVLSQHVRAATSGQNFSQMLSRELGGNSPEEHDKEQLAQQMKSDRANTDRLINALEKLKAGDAAGGISDMKALLPDSSIETLNQAKKAAADVVSKYESIGGEENLNRLKDLIREITPAAPTSPAAPPAGTP